MNFQLIFDLLAGLLVVVAVGLSVKTSILKDVVLPGQEPGYSFARTIGMWWTVIIAFCFIISYGHVGHLVKLNPDCLVLLGIGGGTTAVGRIIDNYDIAKGLKRYQGNQKSPRHFFKDILTDGTGLAVHRFQALVFNVVFGVVFLVEFFNKMEPFPEFGTEMLGLLGISTSTYLGIKANENQ